jgi:glycosyltransferase involved in cell wall biosynthesis
MESESSSSGAKQKIMIAISNVAIGGGAEKVAVELAKKLQIAGHSVVLLTFYTDTNEHVFNGARESRGEISPRSVFGKIPRAFSRITFIKKMCQKHNVDVVISFLEESNYYCLLSKVLLRNRVPMIVSVRLDPRFYNRLYKFLIRRLYPHAASVVAVTKYVEKVLREEFTLTNTTTIYNPIDTDFIKSARLATLPAAWQHLTNEQNLVVSIGRLTTQKGQWHLIRAFAAVVEKNPNAKLVILGDGEYREQLESLIQACQLTSSVILAGKHGNVYPFLNTAKLFVFSSLWEGMPNTVLEALACELPIVATDCDSGPREIIAPEITITDSISYPYHATYGTLVAPFAVTEDPIWESPDIIALSASETMLATEIIKSLQATEKNNLHVSDTRFDPVTIRQQWQTLFNTQT